MTIATSSKDEFDKCRQFITQLWLYLDGSLTKNESNAWDAHLQMCKRCSQELAEARETITAYQGLQDHDIAAAAYAAAIRQAVNPPAKRSRALWKRKRLYWAGPLAAAAALLLFILFPEQPPQKTLDWQPLKIEYNLAQLEDDIYRVETLEMPMIRFGGDDFSATVFDSDLRSIEEQIDALTGEVAKNL